MSDDIQKRIILLNQLIVQLNQQGRYEQAVEVAIQACDLARQQLGTHHPFLATSLNNLAELYRVMGQYTQAEPLYQQALEIRRAVFGETHPAVATSLHNLAALYLTMGDYSRAEPLLLRTLEIRRATLGDTHLEVAHSLNHLALLYKAKGNYAQAESLYWQSLQTRRQLLGANHPSVATSLNNLAELYRAMGNYTRAEPLYQQALAIKRMALGETHPDVAACLNNLAGLYLVQGNYAQAETLYQEALAIQRSMLGEAHPDVAHTLNNLAELYRAKGNYKQAELLHQQALALWNAIPGKSHPNMVASLNNLAELYRAIGDYTNALSLYQQALTIGRRAMGASHPYIATILNNVAELYRQTGNYTQAEPLYQQSLAIRRTMLNETHPEVAQSLNNLASLFYAQGDYTQAEVLYQQALAIRRSMLGEAHPDVAQCLSNLAFVSLSRGNYADAEPLMQKAIEITQKALGDTHPEVAHFFNNLALLYVATGRQNEALASMKRAAAIDDQLIGQVFSLGSEYQRMEYLKTLKGRSDGFLSLVYQYFAHTPDAVQAGFDLLLRRKGIGAEALAVQRDVLLSGRYPALASKLRELATLRMQIAQKTLTGPGSEGLQGHQDILKEWHLQKEQKEKELAYQIPEMNLAPQLQVIDHQTIASTLPERTALVEFVYFDVFDFHSTPAQGKTQWKPARYAAFILQAGKPEHIQFIDVGDADIIDQLIEAFITAIADSTTTARHMKVRSAPSTQRSYTSIGTTLSATLFLHLLDALGDCTQLFLSPDGDLTRLPFEVLPLNHEHTVIDTFRISYLSTGRDLLRFEAPVIGQPSSPLVIADPDFDLREDTVLPAGTITSSLGEQLHLASMSTLRFERLPGTRAEGQQVATLLGVQPLLDRAATETALKKAHSPHILHIATHGFFFPDQQHMTDKETSSEQTIDSSTKSRLERFLEQHGENPLLRSGLALAGVNTWNTGGSLPAEAEDGLLTAEEVSGLDLLDTELAVLSACETGVGKIHIGEGVFGLRRAFVLAGVKTLVMSLWKVPDEHTQELMGKFYHYLQESQPRADALRAAQLAMKEKYAHPFYWEPSSVKDIPVHFHDELLSTLSLHASNTRGAYV